MANADQLKLSTLIKSIHSNLREKSNSIGFQQAWKEHCEDESMLREYANAMKALATAHWENNFKENSKASSRVEWVYKYCLKYFFQNEGKSELLRQRQREREIGTKIDIIVETNYFMQMNNRWKLLDVGSCYNPFAAYDIFDVTAVDIAPAYPNVHKLDFLNFNIKEKSTESSGSPEYLIPEYFHTVIFSLFLEYIPSPDKRFESCIKAYNLLKSEGLLFIITPDSKHVGANAKIMKSWQFLLAEIGFSRIKYEKLPHIHCMVFRKCLDLRISKRWVDLHSNNQLYDRMYIPQDFGTKSELDKEVLIKDKVEDKIDLTEELPFVDIEPNDFFEDT